MEASTEELDALVQSKKVSKAGQAFLGECSHVPLLEKRSGAGVKEGYWLQHREIVREITDA